ncbi:MAG: LacI family DNA-binding transcriptional regulator [Victivallales bacterium]|nr:LacI family DNA-binding transcriptional regulator [Victivallales bacterium]
MPKNTNGFKSDLLVRELQRKIVSGEYALGSSLPTCHQLAHLHGVSYVTAYKVLAQLEHDGYITLKKHVGSTVSYIHNAPQPKPSQKTINLVTAKSNRQMFRDFLEIGQRIFARDGWQVRKFQLESTNTLPDDVLQSINSPDAYSLFFGLHSTFTNTLASEQHFLARAVYLGEYLTDLRVTCITCDEGATVRIALEHFRSMGRTRTAIVRYMKGNITEGQRISTWRSEMMANGASFDWCTAHTLSCQPPPSHDDTQWIRESFLRWKTDGILSEIDSIFIPHEPHAVVFEELCRKDGIHIPEDLAVITLGNDPCLAVANPPLPFLDNGLEHHLELARMLLESRLRGETIPQQLFTFHPVLRLPPHLPNKQ